VLRLKGIHDPLLDHPGWRQGDTAAIARNFATLDPNPLHPQTDYDGPPPNYVELELQIVPFLAALLYKLFGVHEIFGRLLSIGFGLGTIVVAGRLAGFVFRSALAGITAAATYAILPGAVYYSRTFMPDTAMVFFLTLAVLAFARYLSSEREADVRGAWVPAVLGAVAILAKPVALVLLVPVLAMWLAREGPRRLLARPPLYVALAVMLVPLVLYDRAVGSIAEWHWASGITKLHVIPDLLFALHDPAHLVLKLRRFAGAIGLLRATMIGLPLLVLFGVAIVVPQPRRARPLLFGWLAGAVLYAFVVVTVERVDYYLYLVLPLAAIWIGGAVARTAALLPAVRAPRIASAVVAAVALLAIERSNARALAPYYVYDKSVYRSARALSASLPPGALVVMGHYDPSILYYIDRKGWEEDPYLWTPFDEQSAIRKGARSFIAIERNRLQRNVELAAWLERFPITNADAKWPVYRTDPALEIAGAETRWRRFRDLERAGRLPAPP